MSNLRDEIAALDNGLAEVADPESYRLALCDVFDLIDKHEAAYQKYALAYGKCLEDAKNASASRLQPEKLESDERPAREALKFDFRGRSSEEQNMTYAQKMAQPHEYAPNCNPRYPDTCWGCAMPKDDPIHVVAIKEAKHG